MTHVLFVRKFAEDPQRLYTSILISLCEDMNFCIPLTEISTSMYKFN